MATYRELLAQVREEIDEIGTAEARERQGEALFVDVRERDEWEEGAVPGAIHVPRGQLESSREVEHPRHRLRRAALPREPGVPRARPVHR